MRWLWPTRRALLGGGLATAGLAAFGLHRVNARPPVPGGPVRLTVEARRVDSFRPGDPGRQRFGALDGIANVAGGTRPEEWMPLDETPTTSFRQTLALNLDYVFMLCRDAAREWIARGQGGVFVTAHMGCIELCQVLAEKRKGLRLNVLVHTKHAEQFNRVLDRLSPDNKVRFLQVTDWSVVE